MPHRRPPSRHRPAAPRCRNGLSSVLRLSSGSVALAGGADRIAWLRRLALPLAPTGDDAAAQRIVTPLWPSASVAPAPLR